MSVGRIAGLVVMAGVIGGIWSQPDFRYHSVSLGLVFLVMLADSVLVELKKVL